MSKKKPETSDQEEKKELTEWQKRNLEFRQKKEEEQRQQQEKLEQLAQYKLHTDEETGDEDVQEELPIKKKKRPKKEKRSKEKTARQKALYRSLPLLVVSVILLLIAGFIISPLSKMKEITVGQVQHVEKAEVLKETGISDTDYITTVFFNRHQYEKQLQDSDVWVKSANISYNFPNHFNIAVEEYPIVAYAKNGSKYQPLLSNGAKGDIVSESDLPKRYISVELSKSAQLRELAKQFTKLRTGLKRKILTVGLEKSNSTSDLLKLTMSDGVTVRVPLSELSRKLPYYDRIQGSLVEGDIVDMEVGIYVTTEALEESDKEAKEEKAAQDSQETDDSSGNQENSSEENRTSASSTETNDETNTSTESSSTTEAQQ